ncbi:hypothetical protein GCM10007175_24300 [Pseudarthrobacter scleromae]|uniref:Uncharacterized protein n=1 Tax=Pseudarthrobacter scleromae TaxID=158897 RepID=A0ABQ2CGU5_9MICC|nr:hypothetical protein GCM10007175_24300 [Pseudarthrobacter scleromae]
MLRYQPLQLPHNVGVAAQCQFNVEEVLVCVQPGLFHLFQVWNQQLNVGKVRKSRAHEQFEGLAQADRTAGKFARFDCSFSGFNVRAELQQVEFVVFNSQEVAAGPACQAVRGNPLEAVGLKQVPQVRDVHLQLRAWTRGRVAVPEDFNQEIGRYYRVRPQRQAFEDNTQVAAAEGNLDAVSDHLQGTQCPDPQCAHRRAPLTDRPRERAVPSPAAFIDQRPRAPALS